MIDYDYRGYHISYSEELNNDLIDVHNINVEDLMEILIDDYLSKGVSEYQLPELPIYEGKFKFTAFLNIDEEKDNASFNIVKEPQK